MATLVVGRVVEEGPELGTRQLRGRVGEGLEQPLEVELGREDPPHRVEGHQLAQRFLASRLGFLPLAHLGFERLGLLRQVRDHTKTLVRAGQCRVALGRDDLRVLSANPEEQRSVAFATEGGDRIAAEQRERPPVGEGVPQFLETYGGFTLPVRPEQRDHLAEGMHARMVAGCPRNDIADHRLEQLGIRPPIDQHPREGLGRSEREVAPLLAGDGHVHAARPESLLYRLPVRSRRDHDPGLACSETGADEPRHRVDEEGVVAVELCQVHAIARAGRAGVRRVRRLGVSGSHDPSSYVDP